MALAELSNYREFLRFLPAVREAPMSSLWMSCDQEADVLYINFRNAGDDGIGVTILYASRRLRDLLRSPPMNASTRT
jgi:hypothetical protein